MRQALSSAKLFGHVLQGESWYGWRILLIAAAGEKLTDSERVASISTSASAAPIAPKKTLVQIND
jgi:hypothetical protein